MADPPSWNELALEQLVRYEALFKLLEDIQPLEDISQITRRAATQWKYFAAVARWRLVLAQDDRFVVVDASQDEIRIDPVKDLHPWDQAHWEQARPSLEEAGTAGGMPSPPEHLHAQPGTELLVQPFMRAGRCVALLTVAARKAPFSELDKKFIRLFGAHLSDHLAGILFQAKATQLLIDKATHDHLTGLLNRGAIIDHLGNQLALARRTGQAVGIILADIDFFKSINDQHGHLVGDAVLRELAHRLSMRARDGNGLGRYGGEEFLFVLYPCNPQELAAAAERFRSVVADAAFVAMGRHQEDLRVTISLGTATSGRFDDVPMDRLLNQADEALYRSKETGRNRVTDYSAS
ncbi:MAG: GGDEF domain-containing protein [Rhodoferax sp.]|jgi:diguanylate cyclase (GGDEF)-like protein|nr:GGDEF domain-containing protein [Rhodoferax sp.]